MKKTREQQIREPIRTLSAVLAVAGVILLVVAILFQGLALWATTIGAPDLIEKTPWLIPCWIASLVLLPVAAVLNRLLKNKENWPLLALAVAAVGAVLALMVALALKDALPTKVSSNVSIGYEQGLDSWKLIYRHLSSVFAGVLLMIAAAINHYASRADRIRRENDQYVSHYDLSGEPIFDDAGESTIGLDTYAEGAKKPSQPRKLKRSQKAAAKKAQE